MDCRVKPGNDDCDFCICITARSVRSLPACGGGIGRGHATRSREHAKRFICARLPPPPPPPPPQGRGQPHPPPRCDAVSSSSFFAPIPPPPHSRCGEPT